MSYIAVRALLRRMYWDYHVQVEPVSEMYPEPPRHLILSAGLVTDGSPCFCKADLADGWISTSPIY